MGTSKTTLTNKGLAFPPMVVAVPAIEKFVPLGLGTKYLSLAIKLTMEINIDYKICYLLCTALLTPVKVYSRTW